MGTCPTPEKRFYQTYDSAAEAAVAMAKIFGKFMSPYGCACGRFHLKTGSRYSTQSTSRSPEAKRRRRQRYKANRRARSEAVEKPKYKFLYQSGGIYFWENTKPVDSRVEQVYCNARWFWGDGPHYTAIIGRYYSDRRVL